MSLSPPNPKKYKPHLSSLRDALPPPPPPSSSSSSSSGDGGGGTPPPSTEECGRNLSLSFRLLLRSELALRGGPLVPFSGGGGNDGDTGRDSKLLFDAVTSAAGRSLLAKGCGLPPQMLAATSALSALASERTSAWFAAESTAREGVTRGGGGGGAGSSTSVGRRSCVGGSDPSARDALAAASDRCREVSDARFGCLLRMASFSPAEGLSPTQAADTADDFRAALMRLAVGNYVRAATEFADPEQPKMWKMGLDAVLVLNGGGDTGSEKYGEYGTTDAVPFLKNLVRIAEGRGNAARGSELRLRLAEAYLAVVSAGGTGGGGGTAGGDAKGGKNGGVKDGKEGTLRRAAEEAFWTPHLVEKLDGSGSPQAAREALSGVDPSLLSADLGTLLKILRLRVALALEDASVRKDADGRRRRANNRVEEGATIGSGGIAGFGGKNKREKTSSSALAEASGADAHLEGATRDALLASIDDDSAADVDGGDSIDAAAAELRDEVVRLWDVSSAVDGGGVTAAASDAARSLLVRAVERVVERARCVGLTAAQHAALTPKGKKKKADDGDRCFAPEDVSKAWGHVRELAVPVLAAAASSSTVEAGKSYLDLASSAARASLASVWIAIAVPLGGGTDTTSTAEQCRTVLEAVRASRKLREETDKRLAKESGQGAEASASDEVSEDAALRAEEGTALEAARLRLSLARIGCEATDEEDGGGAKKSKKESGDAASDVRSATREALRVLSRKHVPDSVLDADAKYGLGYLRAILAWSGLHRSPFSFCSSAAEARAIVDGGGEACVERAGTSWGRCAVLKLPAGRRTTTQSERTLLDLARADAEGSGVALPGGATSAAEALYGQVLERSERAGEDGSSSSWDRLVRSHCLCGTARLALAGASEGGEESGVAELAGKLAQRALEALLPPAPDDVGGECGVVVPPPWSSGTYLPPALAHRLSASRRLVAECHVRSGRLALAESFLRDAARDAPDDADAAFALGSYLLRTAAASEDGDGDGAKKRRKAARVQLLKAAKLDSSRPDPFTLLGVWYELTGDAARALGCYLKALASEPTHPVAGRGALRLLPEDDDASKGNSLAMKATGVISPVNGWAWRELARTASSSSSSSSLIGAGGGGDDMAATYLQRALRSRDVMAPDGEALGAFFRDPTTTTTDPAAASSARKNEERSETWADLAACYRRMGKHSASRRAYEASAGVSSAGGDLDLDLEGVPFDVLCAWGQVELDLGLHDDAADKFERVLLLSPSLSETSQSPLRPVAAYGLGIASLSLARSDVREGKYGAALTRLERGIEALDGPSADAGCNAGGGNAAAADSLAFGCVLKLRADLRSFGAALPSSAFASAEDADATENDGGGVRDHVAFVSGGEGPLVRLVSMAKSKLAEVEARVEEEKAPSEEVGDSREVAVAVAAALCDLGSNLLLRARLLSTTLGEGDGDGGAPTEDNGSGSHSDVQDLLARSAESYSESIDADSVFPPAWIGLGCALHASRSDPMLAQHCLCRALQLDPGSADAWSNLAAILAGTGSHAAASEAVDALTQVADTPQVWIGRGLLFEGTSRDGRTGTGTGIDDDAEVRMGKAADAYRAALQIDRHPAALLGLAMTSRRIDAFAPGGAEGGTPSWNGEEYAIARGREAERESRGALSAYLRGPYGGGGGFDAPPGLIDALMTAEDAASRRRRGHFAAADAVLEDLGTAATRTKGGAPTMARHTKSPGVESGGAAMRDTLLESNVDLVTHPRTPDIPLDSLRELVVEATKRMKVDTPPPEDSFISVPPKEGLIVELRRKVRESPDDGELWLRFSKELMTQYSSLGSVREKGPSRRVARAALTRTKVLLLRQATDVGTISARKRGGDGDRQGATGNYDALSQKSVVPESADASLLSEALALLSWLDALPCGSGIVRDEDLHLEAQMDLQRALILDPENCFARARLSKST